MFDDAVFSGGIHALEDEQYAEFVRGVKLILQCLDHLHGLIEQFFPSALFPVVELARIIRFDAAQSEVSTVSDAEWLDSPAHGANMEFHTYVFLFFVFPSEFRCFQYNFTLNDITSLWHISQEDIRGICQRNAIMGLMIIIFASIVSLVLTLINFVIYKALVSIFALSLTQRYLAAVVLAVLGLSFIAASVLTFYFNNSFTRVYYTVSASWLGFAAYLFMASCVYALVLLVARFFSPDISLAWFGIICVALALVTGIYGLIHARYIYVKEVAVSLPQLPSEWKGKRAVWISDIHLGAVHGEDFATEIVDKINRINPDIVFVGGDLYDGVKVDEADMVKPFAVLHPALGTYFITGNHEEFRDNGAYLKAVRDIGMRVLNDEMVNVGGVQIIGVDDKDSIDAVKFQTILSGFNIDKTRPAILLKHQPSQLDIAAAAGISLQISGHTHRAQIFPLNLFTSLIFKGYDYGLNKWDNMAVYTSSGVGTWGPPMRVGSDSEIVVFIF